MLLVGSDGSRKGECKFVVAMQPLLFIEFASPSTMLEVMFWIGFDADMLDVNIECESSDWFKLIPLSLGLMFYCVV